MCNLNTGTKQKSGLVFILPYVGGSLVAREVDENEKSHCSVNRKLVIKITFSSQRAFSI